MKTLVGGRGRLQDAYGSGKPVSCVRDIGCRQNETLAPFVAHLGLLDGSAGQEVEVLLLKWAYGFAASPRLYSVNSQLKQTPHRRLGIDPLQHAEFQAVILGFTTEFGNRKSACETSLKMTKIEM
jgi:hypothetical protein